MTRFAFLSMLPFTVVRTGILVTDNKPNPPLVVENNSPYDATVKYRGGTYKAERFSRLTVQWGKDDWESK